MSENAHLDDKLDQLGMALQAIIEDQQRLRAKLDEQARVLTAQTNSLAAIAAAIGHVYISTNRTDGLPGTVLLDPVFAKFLDTYPIEGPPIVGRSAMEKFVAHMLKLDPAGLARGFREVAKSTNFSPVARIRNKQVEHVARERYGDLDLLEAQSDRSIRRSPSEDLER